MGLQGLLCKSPGDSPAGEEVEGPFVGTYEGSDGGMACMGGFHKKVFSDSPEVRTKH